MSVNMRKIMSRGFPGVVLSTFVAAAESTAPQTAAEHALRLEPVMDVPLGGHPTRLDYASLDVGRHLLFIAHLGDSEIIVFDTQSHRVVTRIAGVSHVHGVLAIPELGVVYASATGTNEVVAIDEKTLKIVARTSGGIYPDGLAYAPEAHKVYVSDEHGGTDTVIDVRTHQRVATIRINGEIGNTQYDPVSRHIFVNAQSTAELVEIDPGTDGIVRRLPIPGARENHGLLIDTEKHRAFIACQGNNRLIVLDLNTGFSGGDYPVAKDPDVLALDPARHELYVAGESGEVSSFNTASPQVVPVATAGLAPFAHVVAVDEATHAVYFPLQNVGGRTVLRVFRPM